MFVRRIPPQIGLTAVKALTRSSINPAHNRNKTENLQDLALYKTSFIYSLYQINNNNLELIF